MTHQIVQLQDLEGIPCPCGIARRAFGDRAEVPGTIHYTEIHEQAAEHFHLEHTEVYVVLECEDDAAILLDGTRYPVKPLTSILIPPKVRHCAIGRMKVLIFCTPNFDHNDEHFD